MKHTIILSSVLSLIRINAEWPEIIKKTDFIEGQAGEGLRALVR